VYVCKYVLSLSLSIYIYIYTYIYIKCTHACAGSAKRLGGEY
jgi:hypothetical protein